jgi:LmbE family N-acetylglucosaminyl deacetylase
MARQTACRPRRPSVVLLQTGTQDVSTKAVYLSPHLDDAVLSCGGSICSQALSGTEVLVVTVFAGIPSTVKLSPLATELHDRWGNAQSPVAARRQEDRRALSMLGAEYLHLGFADAIYRSDGDSFLYQSDQDLFGSLHPSDASLIAQVAASLATIQGLPRSTVLVPLAVGNHVDHQMVRDAVLAVDSLFGRVVFYEDYPYVEQPGGLTRALEALAPEGWMPEVNPLSGEHLAAKINAIGAYRSQISTLFGDEDTMTRRVLDYAGGVGPDQEYGERFWRSAGHQHLRGSGTPV